MAEVPHIICWPWHLWFLTTNEGHPRGGDCGRCRRSIAVPRSASGDPLCLYCALELGVAGEDAPLGAQLA